MGWFSTKKKTIVSVSGAIFRVRGDDSIKNTTGLIIGSAVLNNQDITEALLLNELTGTKSSYNLFNRKCKASSTIGLPSTSLTYTTINKEQLAAAIRASIGQSYPSGSDIADQDASIKSIEAIDHHKYALQSSNNFNVDTNVFTYTGLDYYLDSYVDLGSDYTINGHRDQTTTTTVTDAYTVFFGTAPGFPVANWLVLRNRVTDVVVTYNPTGTGSSSSSSVDTYSLYDQIGDPWGLMPLTGTVTVCAIPAHVSLCYPAVTPVTVVQSVSFYISAPKPPSTESVTTYNNTENGVETVVTIIPLFYWVVYYTRLSRRYIWIGRADSVDFLENTTGVNTSTNPELQFAPIVPLRNDRSTVINAQTKRALKTIGLDADVLNGQITQPEVEDVYVSLFSNLITGHMDQLAYNYAFFESMDRFGINISGGRNTLSVQYGGIYSNETSWDQIIKTTGLRGTLPAEYTYTLTPYVAHETGIDENGAVFETLTETKSGHYTIRKRVTANTYDEIQVIQLATSYTVVASGGVVLAFSVDIEPSSGAQIVIPFSYEIANSIPPKYRETLFMRCTQIGLFTKTVQVIKTKWYQQDWFQILVIIITIIVIVYTGYDISSLITNPLTTIGSQAAALETVYGISYAAALAIAVADYIITQYALNLVMKKVLSEVADKGVLTQILTVVAIAYTSGVLGGGEGISTTKEMLATTKTIASAGFQIAQMNLQNGLKKDIKDFNLELSKLEEIQNRLKPLFDEFKKDEIAQQKGQEYLAISNLMKNMGEPMTTEMDVAASEQKADISEQPGMISVFVANALKLIEEETLMIESDTLLEGEAA